jgi:hypothetical protein
LYPIYQWVKVGFSLISLGKAVLDVGMGNPLGLITAGVGALQEMHGHLKDKDDADFNTFISEPFLTSEEQDRLVGGLKKAKFFEEFEYDAQLGAWCKMGAVVDTAAAAAAAATTSGDARTNARVSVAGDSGEDIGTVSAALAAEFVTLEVISAQRAKGAAEAATLPDSARVAAETAGSGKVGLEKWMKSRGATDPGALLSCKAHDGDEAACKEELLEMTGLKMGYHDAAIAKTTLGYVLAVLVHPQTTSAMREELAECFKLYLLSMYEEPEDMLEVLRTQPSSHYYSVVAYCLTSASDNGGQAAAENMFGHLQLLCHAKPEYMDAATMTAIIGMLATVQAHAPSSAEAAEKEAETLSTSMYYWGSAICAKRKFLKVSRL